MIPKAEVVQTHPEGEVQIAGNRPAETVASLDTFAGKVHVKWVPEATVSSLGLMPYFIEFLKTVSAGAKIPIVPVENSPPPEKCRSRYPTLVGGGVETC